MSWGKDTGILYVISRAQFVPRLFVFLRSLRSRCRWAFDGNRSGVSLSRMVIVILRKKKKKGGRFTHTHTDWIFLYRLSYCARRYNRFIGVLFRLPVFPFSFGLPFARFVSHNPTSLVSFPLGGVHKPSRWETINLEYPACSKRTEWKIFFLHSNIPLWVSFFFFSGGLAGTRMHPRVLEISEGRIVLLSDLRFGEASGVPPSKLYCRFY